MSEIHNSASTNHRGGGGRKNMIRLSLYQGKRMIKKEYT